MADPLAEVVMLLKPVARFSKHVQASGTWTTRRAAHGEPFYCLVLDGGCRLQVTGGEELALEAGDFVLVPASVGFSMSSIDRPATSAADAVPVQVADGSFLIGQPDEPVELQILAGHCAFDSPHRDLLVSLLPTLLHVRGVPRLTTLVTLLGEEARQRHPGRDVVLARLLEVLFIEALRADGGAPASGGLIRALADSRLAAALGALHGDPARPWTIATLAQEAALSRSAFFDRFSRTVGVAPMEYLLAWRMTLAKDMLRRRDGVLGAIAERVGYGSASSFSAAFTRHVGMSPSRYQRS